VRSLPVPGEVEHAEFPKIELIDSRFGKLLNNPLTGILGNASAPGGKRLETIAALAVRMRETVRRLSLSCESR